jgi:hypothetical protein
MSNKAPYLWSRLEFQTGILAKIPYEYFYDTATHVIRKESRGYGERRKLWKQTTECGIITDLNKWRYWTGRFSEETCIKCRNILVWRYENEFPYELDDETERILDEYERLEQERLWAIQAERHKPDAELAEDDFWGAEHFDVEPRLVTVYSDCEGYGVQEIWI